MTGTPTDTAPGAQRRDVRQNGAAIRALREKDGLTQTALAEKVGIRQPTLSDIENDAASAYFTTLNRIARALCVPTAAIMRDPGSIPAGHKPGTRTAA